MATNPSTFDAGPVLVPPAAFSSSDHGAEANAAASPVDRDELGQCAREAALTWKPVIDKAALYRLTLDAKRAGDRIRESFAKLRGAAKEQTDLSIDLQSFLNQEAVWQAAQRTLEDAISRSPKLPLVQDSEGQAVPRAYAASASYLRATGYIVAEDTLAAFLNAAQESSSFSYAELWMLQPLAQFAVVEAMAASLAAWSHESENTLPDLNASRTLLRMMESLARLTDLNWKAHLPGIDAADKILHQDPSGAYPRMDFESRDAYRHAVADLAAGASRSEVEVARAAVNLAAAPEVGLSSRARERRAHVGFFLVDKGVNALQEVIGYRASRRSRLRAAILNAPTFSYLFAISAVTLALLALFLAESNSGRAKYVCLALFVPLAIECAVGIANLFAAMLVKPKRIPRMDFSDGIPRENTTLLVVPVLLTSEEQVRQAVRDLEVRHLANRDANLHFALLTDLPDSVTPVDERDVLVDLCSSLIRKLNEDHGLLWGSFFHFHRDRVFNASEKVWMGWERKRGKLLDLNNLLLGKGDCFPVKVGDLTLLQRVKYVITLDADTQLPRDAARRLVGAMAHPLSRPVIDPATNTVVEGHGILQPRVGISIKATYKSRLARIGSGDTGFDIYTCAVSDVYQDLFGEGIFTGKGIYEVETFQKVLEHRFPCNIVLSHDLIEGTYVRAGLVSDVEVIDDYPSHVSAYSRRRHRWVRGDWQIMLWLLPWVPNYFWQSVRNPLSVISRWKIADNLRRSLTEAATFALLVCGWTLLRANALPWTLSILGFMALPVLFQIMIPIFRAGRSLASAAFWKNLAADSARSFAVLLFRLTLLCYQSLVMLDAVVRTLVRMAFTHKRLLQWETAAESEAATTRSDPVERYLLWTPVLSLLIAILVVAVRPASFAIAAPFLLLWGSSKLICEWLNRPDRFLDSSLSVEEESFVRGAALRTWRFFHECSNAEENWLIPDIVQESPAQVARRISPTNLGLLLNARIAACDLGFITFPEFIALTERTLETVRQMPTWKGHLYNWYDTQTLQPVSPLFVSSVDSGNLVCCLWALKQACQEAPSKPLFRETLWQGLRDHLALLEEIAAEHADDRILIPDVHDLKLHLEALSDDPMSWRSLRDLGNQARVIEQKLSHRRLSDDARWWAHQFVVRVNRIEELVYDFAPWLLPQFAALIAELGFDVPRTTLEELPVAQAALQQKLWSLQTNGTADDRIRIAANLLSSLLGRSSALTGDLTRRMAEAARAADALADGMDFAPLYDSRKKLLSIGYDVEAGQLHSCHYDLLMSEARVSAFVAVAKGEIPQESWIRLGRRAASFEDKGLLLSWSGTMFEYLLPVLWMRCYPNTIFERSIQGALSAQRDFGFRRMIPWGVSESSSSRKNPDKFYHYAAFGISATALNKDVPAEVVISPYSTFLASMVNAEASVKNLHCMKEWGWLGRYGFYESCDFTPTRQSPGHYGELVRCWMAHHQGMSLVAAANLLCGSSIQRRFHAEPMVAATEHLLHERFPRTVNKEWFSGAKLTSKLKAELPQRNALGNIPSHS